MTTPFVRIHLRMSDCTSFLRSRSAFTEDKILTTVCKQTNWKILYNKTSSCVNFSLRSPLHAHQSTTIDLTQPSTMDQAHIDRTGFEADKTPSGMETNMAEASSRTENNVTINTNGTGKKTTNGDGSSNELSRDHSANGNKTGQTNGSTSAHSQENNHSTDTSVTPATNGQDPTITTDTAKASPPLIIDTHQPHRYGSPILPLLPLQTTDFQVPKRFSSTSDHLTTLRSIIAATGIYLHADPVIVHRHRTTQHPGPDTLTLLIQSTSSSKSTWSSTIAAARTYLTTASLPLSIEIIDHRILRGVYTLPILATDPLANWAARKKVGIRKVLEEAGVQWASIEFWYRGVGGTRGECEAVVLIGGIVDEGDGGMVGRWWGGGGRGGQGEDEGSG